MTNSLPDLQNLREAIEELDRDLLAKLKERMQLVESIATAKIERAFPFRDQLREEQVLKRVRHNASELGLDAHHVERLYRLIMEMSIAHQQTHILSRATAPLRVAYQGVEGSYSHLTAQRHYGGRKGGVLLTGYETVHHAALALRDASVDVAFLPIENSTAGSINETYDLLADGDVTINQEVIRHVQHCLLALPGATLDELRVVLSHPQALLQCEEFLRRVPWMKPQAEFDTAGSARKVKESGDPTLAAIASESAARVFGLEILETGIQTQKNNFTRFVEVAMEAANCPSDVPCKTSLLLVTAHRPGALGEVLTRFAQRGVNLTKLESRPYPGRPWQYRFYLDVEGHAASVPVSESLESIEELTAELRVLGTYPKAETAQAGAEAKAPPPRTG